MLRDLAGHSHFGGFMALTTTPISRCLDKKLIIFGFEVPDLLAIFLLLSVLNFVFGQSSLKLLLVWSPTLILAALLRFGKRDKPENYLVHILRYQIRPGVWSAFADGSSWAPLPVICLENESESESTR